MIGTLTNTTAPPPEEIGQKKPGQNYSFKNINFHMLNLKSHCKLVLDCFKILINIQKWHHAGRMLTNFSPNAQSASLQNSIII